MPIFIPALLLASLPALAAVGLLVGVGLVVVGLRGRRVGDHPHCRRCGFDLHGLPSDARRCPECGSVVAGPTGLMAEAVRAGRRERRNRPLAWGLAVAGPGALWAATVGGSVLAGHGAYGLMPTPALAWQADLGPWVGDPAGAELARRVSAGALSGSALAGLVADFLADQADPGRPWVEGKGDVIEQAQASAVLPAADWQR